MDTQKPRYTPLNPSLLNIFDIQSAKPSNLRFDPFFTESIANRVRAKSNGYTMVSVVAPAAPPEAKLLKKNSNLSSFLSNLQKKSLNLSLNAKLRA